MSSWTAASSDCSRPVNNYVHVKTADLYRPNARLTPERQGYQVLTPFGKFGYSQISNANLRWAATHLASTALAAREFEEALKRRLLKAGVRGRGGDASAGAEEDLKAE